MTAEYWIKLYMEILNDPKMGTLPDRLWRRVIELFLIAGELNGSEKTGILPDTLQIAWTLRINPQDLQLDLTQIQATGIIEAIPNGWFIPNFAKRQAASSSTERVQRFREREHKRQYNANETDLKRFVAQSRTEQSRAEEGATPAYIPQTSEEKIYCVVTLHPTIPSGEIDSVLDRINKIKKAKLFDDNQAVEYLRPFWQAQHKRYPATTKTFWLDWAVVGEIPADNKANGKGRKRPPLEDGN